MARLPDDSVLGGLPSANSGRPIASLDLSAPGRAMESVGQGIRDLGRGVASGLNAYAESVGRDEETKAKAGYLVDKVKLDEEMDDTNDPEALKAFPERYEKLLSTHAGTISDPRRRERFMLTHAETAAKDAKRAREAQWEAEKGQNMAWYQDNLQTLRDIGVDPKSTDADRQMAIEVGNDIFSEMETKGYLDAVQTQAQRRKWVNSYAWDTFRAMAPEDRAVALSPAYAPGQREEQAFKFFVSKGWSPAQAAGIVGTLSHESVGMNTKARAAGDGADGSDSIGLGQWNGDRAVRLKAFAASKGADWHDFQTQLEFVDYELNTTERDAARALASASTVKDATSAFSDRYERPSGAGQGGYDALHGWASRYSRAAGVAQKFAGMAAGGDRSRQLADFLPPDEQKAVLQEAYDESQRNLRKAAANQRVEAATVGTEVANDLASMQKTGVGREGLTYDRVAGALGEAAAQDWQTQRQQAKAYHEAFDGAETLSADELGQRVNSLAPKPGSANFLDQDKVFEQARRQEDAILKERATDPAAASERHPAVQVVRQAAEYQTTPTGARVLTPNSAQSIVAARMEAQRQLGIVEPSPITKAEGSVIARQLRLIGEDNVAGVERLMRQLQDTYGDFTPMVVQAALVQEKVNRDLASVATEVLGQIAAGQMPSVKTAQQATTAADNQAIADAMQGRKRDIPRPGNELAQMLRDQEAAVRQQDVEARAQADEAARTAPPKVTYDPADLKRLWEGRNNPDVIFEFNAKYQALGQNAADLALKEIGRRLNVKGGR